MRAALLVAVLALGAGCGSGDAEKVCRKDAERWGECVGEVDKALGDDLRRMFESKIAQCVRDESEVAIARACMAAKTCDAWMDCWSHRGKLVPREP